MSDVIHFFDPRPIRGLILASDAPLRYPQTPVPDSQSVVLVDVSLHSTGEFILTLQQDGQPPQQWRGTTDVLDGEDDTMGLAVAGQSRLLFPANERGRITDLFMKLANGIY